MNVYYIPGIVSIYFWKQRHIEHKFGPQGAYGNGEQNIFSIKYQVLGIMMASESNATWVETLRKNKS